MEPGKLHVRRALQVTMAEKYVATLAALPLKKSQRLDMAAGFNDGFRTAVDCLIEMGLIVDAPAPDPVASLADAPAEAKAMLDRAIG